MSILWRDLVSLCCTKLKYVSLQLIDGTIDLSIGGQSVNHLHKPYVKLAAFTDQVALNFWFRAPIPKSSLLSVARQAMATSMFTLD